jgi:hypothetical protein
LLTDAIHFLEDFHSFLAMSAMHTYITALPLSPRDSTLYIQYGEEFGGMATMYHERERENHGFIFE